jgi:aminocarboxymuconate-semialdehyde decarboxylase
MIKPCNCSITDIHTHLVPEHFPAYLGRHSNVAWPSTVAAQACHRHVMISGEIYRTVSNQCWDDAVRLADMDQRGITRQVLSPMPELLSYWLEPEDGTQLCRFLNESIALIVNRHPTRFTGLAAVPLQSLDHAIAELEYAVKELGMAGVEIGGNVNDRPIGDSHFAPFFQAAESLGASVFVHALRPSGMDRLVGPAHLQQVLAFPGEVGLAAASMITGGHLARFPKLRIAFSHGGGTLAMLLPRLQHAWTTLAPLREKIPSEPVAAARTMFFDNLVYDAATIRHLIQTFGPKQIMVGSDYPFSIMDPDPKARLESLELQDTDLEDLAHRNAQRWLFGKVTID